jgi:hypothetical protein
MTYIMNCRSQLLGGDRRIGGILLQPYSDMYFSFDKIKSEFFYQN